jgi:hypothetical protein
MKKELIVKKGVKIMSDHAGSYMLNDILNLLNKEQVFTSFDKAKTQSLIREIIRIATRDYDCNSGEILEGLTEEFEMCYCCLKSSKNIEDGLCENCR